MSLGLHIVVEELGHKIILRIEGRIDAASSALLERKINQMIDEHHHHLLLDFTRVDYLSSSGMRVLLSALKKVKAEKGLFAIFSVSESVQEIVRLAGLDKILHIFANEKEALQYGA